MTRDKHGREVVPGDLIRIPHYTDSRTGRKVYMYKLVIMTDGNRKPIADGKYMMALDLVDAWRCVEQGKDLAAGMTCPISVCGEFEIIDGPDVPNESQRGGITTWYERQKLPAGD